MRIKIVMEDDSMHFELVDTIEEFKNIEVMASVIWPVTYKNILSMEQIKYMLDKYLSVKAIEQSAKSGYTYIILKVDGNPIGFMAYEFKKDILFLSKLYIQPNHQKKGYSKKAIEYLLQFNLPIELTVNKYNTNAYEAYLHMGFKVTDSIVTDIGNGYVMDDYVMRLKK